GRTQRSGSGCVPARERLTEGCMETLGRSRCAPGAQERNTTMKIHRLPRHPKSNAGRARRRRRPALERLEARRLLATFTVDRLAGQAGGLTFEQAIMNANKPSERDRIEFNIPNLGGPGLVARGRFLITQPLDIDGTTQPGYTPERPMIVLQDEARLNNPAIA